jgi:hypothetical protein
VKKTAVHSAVSLATIALAMALAGCATGAESSTAPGTVTLVQTKPPVQLLRNEAIDRIPVPSVESVATTDASVACLSAAEDPQELMRAWHSGFVAEIVSGAAFRVDAIASNLTQAFTDDGWVAETQADGSITLQRDTLDVVITITPEAISDTAARLHVSAVGQCVETAGKDSDEVRNLEDAGA